MNYIIKENWEASDEHLEWVKLTKKDEILLFYGWYWNNTEKNWNFIE